MHQQQMHFSRKLLSVLIVVGNPYRQAWQWVHQKASVLLNARNQEVSTLFDSFVDKRVVVLKVCAQAFNFKGIPY